MPTVLVVEDRPGARYMTVQLMRRAGFQVEEAATGQEGLQKVRASRPDLVLLDVHLPDLDGREVARRIKSDPELASVLVVHLTGASIDVEDRVRGLHGGADAYLTRPIGDEELVANVRALVRLKRRAEEALRIRDDFLSVAAHELRNPLTSLFLAVQRIQRLYRKGPVTSEQALALLNPAEAQLVALRDLVSHLLDVSRMRSRRLEMDFQRLEVRAYLQPLVQRTEPLAAQAGCALTLDAPAEVTVKADPLRLEQILTNLLSNAFKYGAGKPVSVELEGDEAAVRVSVRDGGAGIPEEAQRRIFEPYERASAHSRRESLGLGLFIARELALAHGGDISVASRPGEGSRFTLELPLLREGPDAPAPG